MLPVLFHPPEPARAGGAAIATNPIANKLANRREGIAPSLRLTDSEEMIASGMFLIVEVVNNLAAGLPIGFIPVESQRSGLSAGSEK